MKLLRALEDGECAAADLGLDEIARALCSAKKELVQSFAEIERQRDSVARRSNVINFRRARARLRKQAARKDDHASRASAPS